MEWASKLLFDWKYFPIFASLLWCGDAVLSSLIVNKIPYTEIDWIAYMEEVEGWIIDGNTDYLLLKGNTGPLVYPAGFLYVYAGLRHLTGGGRGQQAIWIAQLIFVAIYLLTLAVVLSIYNKTRLGSPWMAVLLVLSKRVHSLYFLRLFNDCVEMLLVYCAIWCWVHRKWAMGAIIFSLGLSIKMNALLFLPGFLYLAVRNVGILKTLGLTALIVVMQAFIGAPFLLSFPQSYLSKAFELNRVFFHQWTVNLKFLPQEIFVSKPVAIALLGGHLGSLVIFAALRWSRVGGGLLDVLRAVFMLPPSAKPTAGSTSALRGATSARPAAPLKGAAFSDSASYIAYVLFMSNFLGIAFSRTLHYQFYSWYFHTLPFLLAVARPIPLVVRVAILAGIEYAFNVGDAQGLWLADPMRIAAASDKDQVQSAHLKQS